MHTEALEPWKLDLPQKKIRISFPPVWLVLGAIVAVYLAQWVAVALSWLWFVCPNYVSLIDES